MDLNDMENWTPQELECFEGQYDAWIWQQERYEELNNEPRDNK